MTSSTANTAPQSGTPYHIPALLRETVESLDIRPGGVYADATFGGGGHSRAILAALGPEGRLFGFDQDSDAMANAPDDPRFTFVLSNFRYMKNWMRYHNIEHLDGIMADLGVSFHHFDTAQRGFSFREEAPLDMRMNCRSHLTAMDVVNGYTDEQLCRILRLYTDLKQAPRIAAAIVKARSQGELATTTQLAAAVESTLNPRSLKKDLAQVFQALRIEVNGEMTALADFLKSTPKLLRHGGRLAILTYHSIEDRMVKNFMKTGNIEGKLEQDFFGRTSTPWRLVNRSPIVASEEEIERNPRSRSAKLRVAELITQEEKGGNR